MLIPVTEIAKVWLNWVTYLLKDSGWKPCTNSMYPTLTRSFTQDWILFLLPIVVDNFLTDTAVVSHLSLKSIMITCCKLDELKKLTQCSSSPIGILVTGKKESSVPGRFVPMHLTKLYNICSTCCHEVIGKAQTSSPGVLLEQIRDKAQLLSESASAKSIKW